MTKCTNKRYDQFLRVRQKVAQALDDEGCSFGLGMHFLMTYIVESWVDSSADEEDDHLLCCQLKERLKADREAEEDTLC